MIQSLHTAVQQPLDGSVRGGRSSGKASVYHEWAAAMIDTAPSVKAARRVCPPRKESRPAWARRRPGLFRFQE